MHNKYWNTAALLIKLSCTIRTLHTKLGKMANRFKCIIIFCSPTSLPTLTPFCIFSNRQICTWRSSFEHITFIHLLHHSKPSYILEKQITSCDIYSIGRFDTVTNCESKHRPLRMKSSNLQNC